MADNEMWIVGLSIIGIVAVIAIFGMSSMTGRAAMKTTEKSLEEAQMEKPKRRPMMHVGPCAVRERLAEKGIRLKESAQIALKGACETYRENVARDKERVIEAEKSGARERLVVREARRNEEVRFAVDPCTIDHFLARKGVSHRVPRETWDTIEGALDKACRAYREKGGQAFIKPIRKETGSDLVHEEDRALISLHGPCHMEGETCEAECGLDYACCKQRQSQNGHYACMKIQECLNHCQADTVEPVK